MAPHRSELLQSHLHVAPSYQNTRDAGRQKAHGPAADNKDHPVAAVVDLAETCECVDHEVLLTLDCCDGLQQRWES